MTTTVEVKVPDIGDFKDIPIIEVFVKTGDTVKPEDPLISLESDKATMDVPSPVGGTISELKVKLGDKVSEGSLILTLATGVKGAAPADAAADVGFAAAGAPLAKLATSSLRMRPLSPVPFTRPRSTPDSRANLRTPGPA